jgi:hypothetical protein
MQEKLFSRFWLVLAATALVYPVLSNASERDDLQTVSAQLKSAVENIPGIKVETIGNVLVVQGEVDQFASYDGLRRLTEALKDLATPSAKVQVRTTVRLSARGQLAVAKEISEQVANPAINIHFVNDSLFLDGQAENDYQADRAVEIAKCFFQNSGTKGDNREIAKTPEEATNPHVKIIDLLRVKPKGVSHLSGPKGSGH